MPQSKRVRGADIARIDPAMEPIHGHPVRAFRKTARHAQHPHGQRLARHFFQHYLSSVFGAVVNGARLRGCVLVEPDARTRLHRSGLMRGGAGVDKAADPGLQRPFVKLVRGLDIDPLKLGIGGCANMRRVRTRRVDDRIHAFERGLYHPLIAAITNNARGREHAMVDADDLMIPSKRSINSAANAARTAGEKDFHVLVFAE